jgi:ABC-type glycerol-3-phosphate transport system permease component
VKRFNARIICISACWLLFGSLSHAKTLTVLLLANASTQDIIQNFLKEYSREHPGIDFNVSIVQYSARLDGASHWKIYRHVILPLSAPALGAVGILSFTWRWNDYLWPLIVINNQRNYTLQLSLANLVGTNTVEWGTLLAYATLAMLPVLVVFLCFQRYFVKGSLAGSVKG